MHSRIFQFSEKPIEKHEYISADDYIDHWFTNQIADYVNDSSRENDIDWLRGRPGTIIDRDENGEYLIVTSKGEYFKAAFKRFKENIDLIKDCTLDDFISNISMEVWRIKDSYEDQFGFYIEENGNGLMTMDNFVRCCDENARYYIGGTIDYHW